MVDVPLPEAGPRRREHEFEPGIARIDFLGQCRDLVERIDESVACRTARGDEGDGPGRGDDEDDLADELEAGSGHVVDGEEEDRVEGNGRDDRRHPADQPGEPGSQYR